MKAIVRTNDKLCSWLANLTHALSLQAIFAPLVVVAIPFFFFDFPHEEAACQKCDILRV
jgi:hypothetical protein